MSELTTVHWDETRTKRSYANVCNLLTSREEVVLLFGIGQALAADQEEMVVQLADRVIMTPHAAKRLCDMLQDALREYEARFGAPESFTPRAGP